VAIPATIHELTPAWLSRALGVDVAAIEVVLLQERPGRT
jgi:hypothetical protein